MVYRKKVKKAYMTDKYWYVIESNQISFKLLKVADPTNNQQISNKYSRNIQQIFRKYSANIQQIFNKYSTNIQQIFSKYWTNIEQIFIKYSTNNQKYPTNIENILKKGADQEAGEKREDQKGRDCHHSIHKVEFYGDE